MQRNPEIIFVCEHGAAKSILAAAHFNRLAQEMGLDLRASARGTNPDRELSSQAIKGLSEDDLTPTESIPQKLTEADLQLAQRVITLGELPVEHRGQVIFERWDGIPPVSESYAHARDAIVERIRRMLESYVRLHTTSAEAELDIPRQPFIGLFLRFLRFGFLAWGGPVAQIALIRRELVDEEKWISPEKFNRVLSVYQVLPGPEAHELCVYFGMLAGGRPGALLAGLGFMLPGFVFMLTLSWFYVAYGISSPLFQSVFMGMQPAVAALIVRAVHRIGSHALHRETWLWAVAILAGMAQLLKLNFLVTLLAAGLIYALAQRKQRVLAFFLTAGFTAWLIVVGFSEPQAAQGLSDSTTAPTNTASLLTLAWSGLKSGLLTFGGAYTVIPFLQRDAVHAGQAGGWMTDTQFLDGLALSGLLPAPLIIFSTFVGYIGGGAPGAVIITIAIFAPAFAFTMVGHEALERLVNNQSAHAFLDGVTAGVVGLISATALGILSETLTGVHAWIIFSLALVALFGSNSKWIVAVVVLAAGLYGIVLL